MTKQTGVNLNELTKEQLIYLLLKERAISNCFALALSETVANIKKNESAYYTTSVIRNCAYIEDAINKGTAIYLIEDEQNRAEKRKTLRELFDDK